MTKFLFTFRGGRMPEDQETRDAIMASWGAWMSGLGEAIVDPGSMISATSRVAASGVTTTEGASGYLIVAAETPDAAIEIARTCPIHEGGGTVDVGTVV
jgi:hypothetical protein